MARWLLQDALIHKVEVAAKQLAQSCEAVRNARAPSSEQVDAGAVRQFELQLEQDARALEQLLGSLPQAAGGPSTTTAAAGERCCVHRGTAAGGVCSRLLELPGDLLTKVATLAGKDSRLVCSKLRDTYGCPRLALQEPEIAFSIQSVMMGWMDGYIAEPDDLARCVLKLAYAPPSMELGLISSMQARWPGWGGQVTRLVLSDAHKPNVEVLKQLHHLLPGLRELKCAWMAEDPGWMDKNRERQQELVQQLPQFTALTALTALCGSEDVADNSNDPNSTFYFFRVAPRLRSLHADLRLCWLEDDHWPDAVRALAQLTHLELAYSPPMDTDAAQLLAGLAATAGRLKSLVLLSPPQWLGAELGPVLQGLTNLTSLVWSMAPVDAHRDELCWTKATSLERLVLQIPQKSDRIYYERCRKLLDRVHSGFATGLEMPRLKTLQLGITSFDRVQHTMVTFQFKLMLEQLQLKCPGLTSLEFGLTGIGEAAEVAELPDADHMWLNPVGNLSQLRRLQLVIDAEDLRQLGAVAPLATRLTALELDLCHGERLQQLKELREGSGDAERSLATLAALRKLRVGYRGHWCNGPCEGVVAGLVDAISALPRLEHLDISGLASACKLQATWLAIVERLPASLRQCV